MASNRLKASDLVDIASIKKAFETIRKEMAITQGEIRKGAANSKKALEAAIDSKVLVTTLRDQTTRVKEANKQWKLLEKTKVELDQFESQQVIRTQRELLKNQKLEQQVLVGLRKEKERQLKLSEKIKKDLEKENDLYAIQSKELNKLRKQYKNQVIAQKGSRKGTKALRIEIQKLDKSLKKLDAEVGQNFRSIGDYGKALKGLSGQLLGAFGIIGGVTLFAGALTNAFNRVKEFDKEIVTLGSIFNKTREEMAGLEQTIIDVAGSSVKTSSEVAKLATSLATLGKGEEEIAQLLEPINNLSIGLQASSDEAGELLVQTLNAFGKGSREAQKFSDIIAAMRTSTALDFERIKIALGFLAPTAKAAGLSFQKTGALLGVLVDNGIKAQRAGRLLSSAFLRLAKSGITLEDGLDKINKAQEENVTNTELLAIAAKTFGAEAAPLALILANNRDRVAELTKELDKNGGLQALVNKQSQSLAARLALLDSAWEKIILSVKGSAGVFSSIIDVITFLVRNIGFLITAVTGAGVAWALYRLAGLKALSTTILLTNATKGATVATVIYSRVVKLAAVAQRIFNVAVRANPLGLLLVGITAVITAYLLFTSATEDAKVAQDKLNTSIVDGEKIFALLDDKVTNVRLTGRLELIRELVEATSKAVGELTAVQLESLAETLRGKIAIAARIAADELDEVHKPLKIQRLNQLKDALDLVNAELERIKKLANSASGSSGVGGLAKEAKNASSRIEFLTTTLANLRKELLRASGAGEVIDPEVVKRMIAFDKELKRARDRVEGLEEAIRNLRNEELKLLDAKDIFPNPLAVPIEFVPIEPPEGRDLLDDLAKFEKTANETFDLLDDFRQASDEKEIADLERKLEDKNILVAEAVAKGVLTEKEGDVQKLKNIRAHNDELNRIALASAKRQRAIEVFQATIAGIRAVIQAGPNVPAQVLTGIFNAAQIALIASKPLPGFKKGGAFDPETGMIGGKSHAAGGTKFYDENGVAQFEAQKNEKLFIINDKAVPFYDWMNKQTSKDIKTQTQTHDPRIFTQLKRNKNINIQNADYMAEMTGRSVAKHINDNKYYNERYR